MSLSKDVEDNGDDEKCGGVIDESLGCKKNPNIKQGH